jgi:hypothetical protein
MENNKFARNVEIFFSLERETEREGEGEGEGEGEE